MKFTGNIGFILLAVFLILTGLTAFVTLNIDGIAKILGALAIASGVLILVGK